MTPCRAFHRPTQISLGTTPRLTPRALRAAIVLAALALAGCDARNPAASAPPAPAPAPRPRFEVTAPVTLGQVDVAIPPTTLTQGTWTPADIPVDSGRWVLIRVHGLVRQEYNAECARLDPHNPSLILCGPGTLDGYESGPLSSAGSGGVEVALQRGAQATPVPPGGQPAAPIDMYVPLGGDSSTAEALVEVQRPLNVWYRKQIAVRFANSIDGSIKPFGAYLLSGTQTLQVFEIPTPLQVSGPTSVSPGDTATFTARLTGNYRIELKGNPVSPGPYWTFYVDDTTAVPLPNPGARYQSEDIPACLGQMTCRFAPDRPGRVQVLGYVESRAVKYRSDVVRLDQGKLTLDCNGAKAPAPVTVVRGDSIKCTAATGPADLPIAEISWAFDDSASHHITGPPGARNWDGIMVVPGTMRLTARVSGQEQNLSMDVSIRARDWTGLIAFPEEPQPEWVNGPPLLYPPIVDGDTLRDGTLGQSTWPKPEPQSGYADGTGPNSGWYFFDKPPYFSPQGAHIYLNKALQPSDPFWRAQNGPPSDHVVTGRPECGPDFMRLAARKVPLHEHGHYSQARELAESPRGAALLESAVRWGEPITDEEQDSVVSAYLRADRALVAHWDSTDVLNVPCDFTRPRN